MSHAPMHWKLEMNSSPSAEVAPSWVAFSSSASAASHTASKLVGARHPARDVGAQQHLVAPTGFEPEQVVEARHRLEVSGRDPITAAAWRMPSGVHHP